MATQSLPSAVGSSARSGKGIPGSRSVKEKFGSIGLGRDGLRDK